MFRLRLYFSPRPGYARTIPTIQLKSRRIEVYTNNEKLILVFSKDVTLEESSKGTVAMRFSLEKGEEIWFALRYGEDLNADISTKSFAATRQFWRNWLGMYKEGLSFGSYASLVRRSLLVVKLLTFKPSGALIAAATTSLPESLGGERNWDYRFPWLRDASMTLKAMVSMGHIAETGSFIHWLYNVYTVCGKDKLQIMYSVEGDSELKEEILFHLKGYENSRPVRIGNDAYKQKQNDIYGEVMDTALRLSDYAGKIDVPLWNFLQTICEMAIRDWREPDNGIWEVRNGPFHFVYSKVMCWVALDRGITIAKRYGFEVDIGRWEEEAEKIKCDVLKNGYDEEANTFVQRYGAKDIDAGTLLIPLVRFLPIDDPRVQGTIKACMRGLMQGDFLLRYKSEDGLQGEEGGFLLCNFWLIECLILSNRLAEAEDLLNKTIPAANHLGLFSEEYEAKMGRMLGNFPQAFSHIGFINAVNALFEKKQKALKREKPTLKNRIKNLFPSTVVLNEGPSYEGRAKGKDKNIAAKLKNSLLAMKGKYFDVGEGRVNYSMLKKSKDYKEYINCVQSLAYFNPFSLTTDEEKKAFWINIYNILTIHGVIELNIQHSVKEVFQFFRRISYKIGDYYFTPDDIEHGILRANKPHPSYRKRAFSGKDPRLELAVKGLDPRIHCALVCASSSCPPISFYDSEYIDEQLSLAARSFINRKGLVIDKIHTTLYVSQIFKWYEEDFGGGKGAIIYFLLNYVNEDVKTYINNNREKIRIAYSAYDWNLNRSLHEL